MGVKISCGKKLNFDDQATSIELIPDLQDDQQILAQFPSQNDPKSFHNLYFSEAVKEYPILDSTLNQTLRPFKNFGRFKSQFYHSKDRYSKLKDRLDKLFSQAHFNDELSVPSNDSSDRSEFFFLSDTIIPHSQPPERQGQTKRRGTVQLEPRKGILKSCAQIGLKQSNQLSETKGTTRMVSVRFNIPSKKQKKGNRGKNTQEKFHHNQHHHQRESILMKLAQSHRVVPRYSAI